MENKPATAIPGPQKPPSPNFDNASERPARFGRLDGCRPAASLNERSGVYQKPAVAVSLALRKPDGLVYEIKEALPDITDSCLARLMKAFGELGVKSQEDVMLVEPRVMVEILGGAQAKQLVAYFNKRSPSAGLIVTDGARDMDNRVPRVNQFRGTMLEWCMVLLQTWVNAVPQISAACAEVSASWRRGHERRQEILEDTLRNMDEMLARANRIHDDTVEGLNTSLSRATQAHEKMLQDLREEEARFAETMEQKLEKRRKLEEQKLLEQYQERERRKLEVGHCSRIRKWCMALLQRLVDALWPTCADGSVGSASSDAGQERRKQIMEDTLRNTNETLTQPNGTHADAVEGLTTGLSRATEAHEEMIPDRREEDPHFAKAMEDRREKRRKLEKKQQQERRKLEEKQQQERRKLEEKQQQEMRKLEEKQDQERRKLKEKQDQEMRKLEEKQEQERRRKQEEGQEQDRREKREKRRKLEEEQERRKLEEKQEKERRKQEEGQKKERRRKLEEKQEEI